MKTKNALLTTSAALLIAGAAVVGGYYVDRHSTLTTTAVDETYAPPQSVTVAPPKTAKSTTMASRTAPETATAPATEVQREPMREMAIDNAMIALSGTITEKKGSVLMMKDGASSEVRVVVREDMPRPSDRRAVSAVDKVQIGDTVTIYGKLRTNEDMPKVYAEAIYDSATKTLYHVNGDRPAKELTSAEITSRYTPVKSVQTAKITTTKVMTARD